MKLRTWQMIGRTCSMPSMASWTAVLFSLHQNWAVKIFCDPSLTSKEICSARERSRRWPYCPKNPRALRRKVCINLCSFRSSSAFILVFVLLLCVFLLFCVCLCVWCFLIVFFIAFLFFLLFFVISVGFCMFFFCLFVVCFEHFCFLLLFVIYFVFCVVFFVCLFLLLLVFTFLPFIFSFCLSFVLLCSFCHFM